MHHYPKRQDIFKTLFASITKRKIHPRTSILCDKFESLYHSISTPHLDDLTQFTILWYFSYKQTLYKISKCCILFQFTSPLNNSVIITRIKLLLNHILKFVSYRFYHKSSSTYSIFEIQNLLISTHPYQSSYS